MFCSWVYVLGVSTRKAKKITQELSSHSFPASAISSVDKNLNENLDRFSKRVPEESCPYPILDARYDKLRESGVIRNQALHIAIGINEEGRRQILAVEFTGRESETSWKEFLNELKSRGLRGVEFVASDDHPDLRRAVSLMIPEACWQRCCVHFLRNAADHLPRKARDDSLQELQWLYDRRDLGEACIDLDLNGANMQVVK